MEASTSLTEVASDLNDEQLLALASPPADRLFPLLRHAAAMRPLVVLAAVLPGLLAIHGSPLTNEIALLNLRTLDLLSSTSSDLLQVESSYNNLLFPHTAPLTAWLQVSWLDLFGTELQSNFVFTQYLSTAAIVGLIFGLGHRLGGMRMGLFSSLLVCCQPQMLWSARTAGFGAFPTALFLICLWSVHKLWQEQISSVSLTQFLAGVSAAFCAMSGGPMFLALACCLILNRCAWDVLLWYHDHSPATRNKRRRIMYRGWKSLGVIGAYTILLSGWWYLWMIWSFGFEFIGEWFQPWLGVRAATSVPWDKQTTISQFFPGIMSGLTVLGCVQALREILGQEHEGRESRRSECIWLLTWVGTAASFWVVAERLVADNPAFLEIWRLFLIVPLCLAAAWGVVEIADRRISLPVLIGYAVFSVVISLIQFRARWGDRAYLFQMATLILCLIAASPVFLWKLLRSRRYEERRERQILALITLSLIGLTVVDGLTIIYRDSAMPGELQTLRKDLAGFKQVDRLVFASPVSISPQLEYVIRSRWPYVPVNHVSDWNSGMNSLAQHRSVAERNTGELLICWDISEAGRYKDLQNPVIVIPAVNTRIFQEKELNIFLCERVAPPATSGK